MPLFNEILVGRFNRALQKLTGIKGAAPVKQLGSEVIATFPLGLGVEFRYLESWQRFRVSVTSGPLAAITSGVRMRNPAGSNVVAVIEGCAVGQFPTDPSPGSINLNRGQIGVDLDTTAGLAGASQREDPRGQQFSTCILSVNTVALTLLNNATVIKQTFVALSTSTETIVTQNQEILLMPGDALQWSQSASQNLACRVVLVWRERFLEESERT